MAAGGPRTPDPGAVPAVPPLARGPAPERPVTVVRWTTDEATGRLVATSPPTSDLVAAEEPLQIVLDGESFAVVMRTPGHDLELVLGLLFAEGLIDSTGDVASAAVSVSGLDEGSDRAAFPLKPLPEAENLVELGLVRGVARERAGWQRNLVVSTACGICGAAALDALREDLRPLLPGPTFRAAALRELEPALGRAQETFRLTGGLHAAGLFDRLGRLEVLREDVGRHNAVDKLVGRALLRGELPLGERGLLVSGRASFELAHKAVAAGIPLLAAVSAPSSLAVHVAHTFGLTLVGFLRHGRFNVYAGPERIIA